MNRIISKITEIGYALKPLRQDFRQFHICGIFKKNKLISLGVNSNKTHRLALTYGYPWADRSLHAETSAIIRGKLEDYRGHDLIVIRIDNNNKLNMSLPCKFCKNLLDSMNFDNIYYSDEFGMIKKYE